MNPKAELCLKALLEQNKVFYISKDPKTSETLIKHSKLYADWMLACEIAFSEEIQLPLFSEVSQAIKSGKIPAPKSFAYKIYSECEDDIKAHIIENNADHFDEDGNIICDDCTLILQDTITQITTEVWETQYSPGERLPDDKILLQLSSEPTQMRLF